MSGGRTCERHGRIGLRRHLRLEVVVGDAVYLFSEKGVTALRGAHVETLVPLLDGTRDFATLLAEPHGVPPETVAGMLDRLDAAGLLATHRSGRGAADAAAGLAYWDAAGLDALDAVSRLARVDVRVRSVGPVRSDTMVAALARAGLAVETSDGGAGGPDHDFTVVLCTDYSDPLLEEIAQAHRRSATPWLIVKPVGEQVWVGPIVEPGTGACWSCLSTRLTANRPLDTHVRAGGPWRSADRPAVLLPSVAALATDVAALEATKWLAGYRHPGQQKLWTCDSLTLQVAEHHVQYRPQCPTCGDPEVLHKKAYQPVSIGSRPKRSRGGGGHRSSPPGEVLERYRHLVSPITGVVKDIWRDPRGPDFFNSYRSGVNQASRARGVDGLRSALRGDNGGKGVTPLHAEVGALCEAVERYCGDFNGDEATVRGSLRSLGVSAVHPDSYRLYHLRQFADREAWNSRHSPFQHVGDPFDEQAEMAWTPVWSVTNGSCRLLPTGMLYYAAPGSPGFRADSNGCAAGSSVEDAVLQGLLELVERDAVALWWYNRTAMPAVDLDTAGDPWIDELREVYHDLGREVWVLDLTSDLGVPVMAAVSRRTGGPREDVMFGFGAHPDPHVALRRALTELNQSMPPLIGASDQQLLDSGDLDLVRWLTRATVANQPYLLPDPTAQARPLSGYGYVAEQDLAVDIGAIRARLEADGLEMLVLDQTRPDVGLPVVRVIVPGLRHFWSRFAPGRLYDVPVRLGRIAAPTAFEDLNPLPMFM